MVEVTESATKQIAEYFNGKEVSPIRVFLNEGGWGGPSLAMALDEPKDSDEVYEIEGFKYVVDKDFMEKAKPVKIDFTTYGFKLSSNIDFGPVSSGCAGCSTDGSCG